MSRELIVLPDDSADPILNAITGATKTIRVKMFVFSDPALLKAIIGAGHRGVQVRVMLNPARRNGEEDNAATRKALEGAGIEVKDANPAFALTHEKSMVVDNAKAFINSLNWTTQNLTVTRDYAVVTTDSREVEEITECFEADWYRRAFEPGRNPHLIWCPGAGRDRICQFIDGARRKLFAQNERFQDAVIIERLIRAARRGVEVHIMARTAHTLSRDKLVEGVGGLRILDDVGITVRKLKGLKLDGKILSADGSAAIVGSINFVPGSFEGRRGWRSKCMTRKSGSPPHSSPARLEAFSSVRSFR